MEVYFAAWLKNHMELKTILNRVGQNKTAAKPEAPKTINLKDSELAGESLREGYHVPPPSAFCPSKLIFARQPKACGQQDIILISPLVGREQVWSTPATFRK